MQIIFGRKPYKTGKAYYLQGEFLETDLVPEKIGRLLLEKLTEMGYVEKKKGKYYLNESGEGMLGMIGITKDELYK
jgi:hypothetical protein